MDTRSHSNEPPRIAAATMILLGVEWFGAQIFWAFHAGTMPLFLTGFTDSKFTISLVLSLAGVTGLIIPPTVGYLSDRASTRWGRRRPSFLLIGLVLLQLVRTPVDSSSAAGSPHP
jgi:Na+/melibiose symporter-like transporter